MFITLGCSRARRHRRTGSLRRSSIGHSGCAGDRAGAVFGDHIQSRDNNAVVGRTGARSRIRFLSDDFDVVAHMWFQVHGAAGDFESLSCAFLRYGVITIGATKASLDASLVGVATRRGSLSKRECDQHHRYNDQQKYIFHRILLRFSTGGGLDCHLGFDFASDSLTQNSRALCTGRASGLGTLSIQSGIGDTLLSMDSIVCSIPLTLLLGSLSSFY